MRWLQLLILPALGTYNPAFCFCFCNFTRQAATGLTTSDKRTVLGIPSKGHTGPALDSSRLQAQLQRTNNSALRDLPERRTSYHLTWSGHWDRNSRRGNEPRLTTDLGRRSLGGRQSSQIP
ncbi:hypothetical protein B0T16DRAFT_224275 [Cercophora newfieldiana]|uniref:Secreted protein n=1 Tax=Cercophora newfieldiana TaxID=92897 RepID=A0AA39XYB3_9PEZI|nr:hypothetical protein B0T16DRAFT_224275 [Cercophora newfieldiana]